MNNQVLDPNKPVDAIKILLLAALETNAPYRQHNVYLQCAGTLEKLLPPASDSDPV